MEFQIIGNVDRKRLYCAGSFTKLLTTYVSLSRLAETHDLNTILDDKNFLNTVCVNQSSQDFLKLFQNIIGSRFTLRDLCSFYSGLPYTFDLTAAELASVEAGNPFKHHSILDEKTFLAMCQHQITPVYTAECKFHYSEIAIIFLGYLMEKIYDINIETLFQKYIFDKFTLKHSQFSRVRPDNVYCQDLSDKYDYPSIAIVDHGYFCYSNGFYTTLNDMQQLLPDLLQQPVFNVMVDIKQARAASNRLLNGLTIEIRLVNDDVLYGYEGLSFSGCNIWAYSTKLQQGYITFSNNEEEVYDIIYGQWGYTIFDKVPDYTQQLYDRFIKNYHADLPSQDVPSEYQGKYHRVKINSKELSIIFVVGKDFMIIRNPDEIKYNIVCVNGIYRILGKDKIYGARVGFYQADSGNCYMLFDGTLYKKL